jgi:alpha-galactosidase
MPPRGYRLQTYDLDEVGRGVSFGAAEDGRSSGEYVPWFALMNDAGGLLAALSWSGRWSLDAVRHGDSNLVSMGISDFSRRLAPGERLTLPSLVMAGYAGDLDDGANGWRRWLTDYWMPPVPEDWPWIQYNHWYAYYGDIDAARLLDEARLAADVGCEVFVIDDGWFRGRRPDSYVAGWGDWVEDRAKFPEGIHAFGNQVRSLGMRFGLWVEPERADDNGELVRQHPDWIATSGGKPIYRCGPNGNEGVHLCLGNSEVQRWMADEMIRVVREYGVDWLKWDYNIGYGRGCDASDHGHQATDGHYAHTHGLYQVLGELRTACPDLVIENCASGGHRVDLGTLRHTHTNWVSDYTHRAASCRQHAQGAGLFLPLAHVNTWALEDRDLTGFRSRMGGAFGVSSFMGTWTEDEQETFRRAVEEYKRLRPLLRGDRFLLTGPWHGDWDIWQLVNPSGDVMAILAFRENGSISKVQVIPRILHMDRTWSVQYASGDAAFKMPGADIASEGISIRLPQARDSVIIWMTAVD